MGGGGITEDSCLPKSDLTLHVPVKGTQTMATPRPPSKKQTTKNDNNNKKTPPKTKQTTRQKQTQNNNNRIIFIFLSNGNNETKQTTTTRQKQTQNNNNSIFYFFNIFLSNGNNISQQRAALLAKPGVTEDKASGTQCLPADHNHNLQRETEQQACRPEKRPDPNQTECMPAHGHSYTATPHPPFPILHPVLWLTESDRRSFSTEFHSSSAVQARCCFTSTETIRTIKDGEPRTATSTFTQLLSTASSHADAPKQH